MKPAFALSLSFEGISLLHRTAGGWRSVGEVPVDSADLQAELSNLRARALTLDTVLQCKVIIPDDQIRYLSVDVGEFRGEAEQNILENAISSATPYGLEELKYDVAMDGPIAHIAAVALDTLSEAEEFAIQNGFEPVSYVAAPRNDTFPGEPFFGPSRITLGLTGSNAVEPDGVAVMDLGPVEFPTPTPPVVSTRPAEAEPSDALPQKAETKKQASKPTPAPKATTPEREIKVGFSTRRSAPPAEPVAPQATPDVPPVQKSKQAVQDHDAPSPKTTYTAADDQSETGFSSKRTPVAAASSKVKPAPSETPPSVAQPIAVSDTALDFASQKKPKAAASRNESERLTVFGARKPQKVGGKPKFLGVMLAALLVLFIAAVAGWAAFFSDTGFPGLSREPDSSPTSAEPQDPPAPDAPDPAASQSDATPDPKPELPDLVASVPREVDGPFQSKTPSLTDTDSAVLDALRVKPQQVELAPAEPLVGEALYAATGIWPQAPQSPPPPGIIGLDDLYVASIDRTDLFQDAIALPALGSFDTDKSIARSASPVAAGSRFELDARGLVKPSPQGTLSPDGILVHLGRPPVVPPTPPVRFEVEPEQADTQQDYLATLRPKLRPEKLLENNERAQLGGLSRAELAKERPKLRPKALATAYAKAEAEAEAEKSDPEALPDATATATALAVARSPLPKRRPKGLAAPVKRNTNLGSVAGLSDAPNAPEPGTFVARSVTPKKPSTASVARQATMENAINLRRVNLIGVYGTPANRRALIRLPSGRYKKVKVGDRVDGGRVVAIGDSELRYQKSGRNMTLKIPKG